MSLEKSVLTEPIISNLLSTHYGIFPLSVNKLKLGTANCFQVYDGNKCYFLKEFQSDISEEEVVREAKLLDYLSDAEFPVTRFYKTLHNEFVIKYQNHILCLEEYMEGHTYGYNDLPLELLPKVGRMLGKLHQALKDYSLPFGMSEQWLESISVDSVMEKYDELIQIAESKADADKLPQLIEDFRYKKQLAVRCEEYKKYYNGITYCSTHGDYQGCQLICDDEHIKAVVDFSSARVLPVVWEIIQDIDELENINDYKSDENQLGLAIKAAKEALKDSELDELERMVKPVYPDFANRLYKLYNMSRHEYHVCLLLKVNISPVLIANALCREVSSISSTRSRLYGKVFGKKGGAKEWDAFISTL